MDLHGKAGTDVLRSLRSCHVASPSSTTANPTKRPPGGPFAWLVARPGLSISPLTLIPHATHSEELGDSWHRCGSRADLRARLSFGGLELPNCLMCATALPSGVRAGLTRAGRLAVENVRTCIRMHLHIDENHNVPHVDASRGVTAHARHERTRLRLRAVRPTHAERVAAAQAASLLCARLRHEA